MSLSIKGDPEVDMLAEQKAAETCQFLKDNLRQLGEPVLRKLLVLFDEANVGLRAGLEVRLKQSIGGTYSNGFKELKERVHDLERRMREYDSPLTDDEMQENMTDELAEDQKDSLEGEFVE